MNKYKNLLKCLNNFKNLNQQINFFNQTLIMKFIIYYDTFDPIYKINKLIIKELYKKFDYIFIVVSEFEKTMFNIDYRINFINHFIINNFPHSINEEDNKIHILKESDFNTSPKDVLEAKCSINKIKSVGEIYMINKDKYEFSFEKYSKSEAFYKFVNESIEDSENIKQIYIELKNDGEIIFNDKIKIENNKINFNNEIKFKIEKYIYDL